MLTISEYLERLKKNKNLSATQSLTIPKNSLQSEELLTDKQELALCMNCHKRFRRLKNAAKPKKFCSQRCSHAYIYAHPRPNGKAYTLICEYCGKEYILYQKPHKGRKYCSMSCSGKARHDKTREEHKT